MSDSAVLEGLASIVNEVAGVPAERVVPEASFRNDLEIDSLTMVEVVVAAEDRFGVRIPDDQVEGLRTVGDAVEFVIRTAAA